MRVCVPCSRNAAAFDRAFFGRLPLEPVAEREAEAEGAGRPEAGP